MKFVMVMAAMLLGGALCWAWTPAQIPVASPVGVKLFDESVATILETHCVECHGGAHKEAGFDLTTREGLLKGGDYGPAIVPGKSAESMLIVLVRHEDEPYMPEDKPKLSDADIAKLTAWVDAGAPYPRPLKKSGAK